MVRPLSVSKQGIGRHRESCVLRLLTWREHALGKVQSRMLRKSRGKGRPGLRATAKIHLDYVLGKKSSAEILTRGLH